MSAVDIFCLFQIICYDTAVSCFFCIFKLPFNFQGASLAFLSPQFSSLMVTGKCLCSLELLGRSLCHRKMCFNSPWRLHPGEGGLQTWFSLQDALSRGWIQPCFGTWNKGKKRYFNANSPVVTNVVSGSTLWALMRLWEFPAAPDVTNGKNQSRQGMFYSHEFSLAGQCSIPNASWVGDLSEAWEAVHQQIRKSLPYIRIFPSAFSSHRCQAVPIWN